MKWIKFSLVLTFLLFCFNADSATPIPVRVASPFFQNAQALKNESRIETIISSRCALMKENMDDAKAVMMNKNPLFRNACSLYQGWIDLFHQSKCTDIDRDVPADFSCNDETASACQNIKTQDAEAWRWMDVGYRSCIVSFWQSGCEKLNAASNQCRSVNCSGGCGTQFNCSIDGFLHTLYGGQAQRDNSECIRQMEESRVRVPL